MEKGQLGAGATDRSRDPQAWAGQVTTDDWTFNLQKCSTSAINLQHASQKNADHKITKEVRLLLVGSLGNGKSATGNAILGKKLFQNKASTNAARQDQNSRVAVGDTWVHGIRVSVVDGPSIHSSGSINQEFLNNLIDDVETSLEHCYFAFNAILIVLKFGVRFTNQEAESLRLIKSILGNHVIKDFGICVVTYGDNFELAAEEAQENGEVLTFEGWCKDQTGEVKALFEECSYRCVLFNNRTRDESKQADQVRQLLQFLSPEKVYSKEQFLAADEGVKVLSLEALAPSVGEKVQQFVTETRSQLIECSSYSTGDVYKQMTQLLDRVSEQQKTLQELGQGHATFEKFETKLNILYLEISRQISKLKEVEQEELPYYTKEPMLPRASALKSDENTSWKPTEGMSTSINVLPNQAEKPTSLDQDAQENQEEDWSVTLERIKRRIEMSESSEDITLSPTKKRFALIRSFFNWVSKKLFFK